MARATASGGELPRAGAPRPLRLIAPDGSALTGSPTDIAWERRGDGVFFTLERDGTRNIWRAFPDPQDASRYPAWRALPVTTLRAPRYAAQPCPLPGDRALVCVSNALSSAPQAARIAQIVRYDLARAEFRALSDGVRLYDAPHVSPDGTRVAFAGGQGAATNVFVAPAQNLDNRALPAVSQVATGARYPVWLDNQTLLVESLAPNARGLYWLQPNNARAPQVVVGGGGEANALGENGIVFSAKTALDAPPNLYVVARDGSGLRILNETQNARRPATSPDGSMLAYDAPQGDARALWVIPLQRVTKDEITGTTAAAIAANINGAPSNKMVAGVTATNRAAPKSQDANSPLARLRRSGLRLIADEAARYEMPVAQLSSARASSEGVAIIGRLSGAANATVLLEVGEGEKPRRFETLRAQFPPVSPLLDAQGNRVLATWNPPPRARGTWTVRLSLSGLGGATQSLLRVRLPLPAQPSLPAPNPAPPQTPTPPPADPLDKMPPRGPFVPLPSLSIPPIVLPPIPTSNGDSAGDTPIFPDLTTLESPFAPLPVAPVKAPTTLQTDIVPIDPARFGATPPIKMPQATPAATSEATGDEDDGAYGDRPSAPASDPFVAQFNVAGTPARMAPREKLQVTFWGWNRGSSTWQTGGSGADRVRLVARWIDFSTGTRRQWNFFWLREAVAPGQRTKWEFDLTAPARPGKYKLIYGLVRLPATGEFAAPAYNAPQESWPDEFGAIAFAVEVGAASP